MNAMIFAAGLGTRLKPLTDTMPKALVPVNGKPLLAHVMEKLHMSGFDNIVVNVHHFAGQIIDYLKTTDVKISDERERLLDTGGGLKVALPLFGNNDHVLVHNVDILSNVDLRRFYGDAQPNEVSLLVSWRQTKRYLLFDDDMRLVGWTNIETGEVRSPQANLNPRDCHMMAFSGIHCVSPAVSRLMADWPDRFPIMDFYLQNCRDLTIKGLVYDGLKIVDVGKLDTLDRIKASDYANE